MSPSVDCPTDDPDQTYADQRNITSLEAKNKCAGFRKERHLGPVDDITYPTKTIVLSCYERFASEGSASSLTVDISERSS
jgi:hypothetical protein